MWKTIQNQYISLILVILLVLFQAGISFAEFTIDDEKKAGKEFYNNLVKHKLITDNKKLNDYITNIGNLILAQSSRAPFEFHFYVVDISAINAFATPGGFIYICKGLINAVENEAQLAGVIAHEIAHANSRHIASIIEKSKKLNYATLAGLLAGALLGGGGEGTAAVAALTLAGATAMTLKYQREHEEEADRLGITYLVAAGYYPNAMIDFLKIMKSYEFLSKRIPSYLLTHPGTDIRIFYLDGLIQTKYRHYGAKNIVGNFNRMQAQALLMSDSGNLRVRYGQLLEDIKKTPRNLDLLYCLAAIEDKMNLTDKALANYEKALAIAPDDLDILNSIGLLHLRMGNAIQAKNYLLRAASLDSSNDETLFSLGKAYLALGNYQKALESFIKPDNRVLAEQDINYFIATAYGKQHNQGESHYYFGLHFRKDKKHKSALFHFNEALKYFAADSARAEAIRQEISTLKK